MPGPFPGMDPYLESPVYWRGFHNGLIIYMAAALNRILPFGFRAAPNERVYIEPSGRGIYPNAAVLTQRRSAPPEARGGGVAVAEVSDTPEMLTLLSERMKEGFLKIITIGATGRVVTIIELLSPANKAMGRGRAEYLHKQQEVLDSDVNLLEIDLHRMGAHTVAAPREELLEYGRWDYLACLSRAASRETFEFWRNSVRCRLPILRVPLLDGEPDAALDLQAAFNETYDALRLADSIDYASPLPLAFEGEDAVWLDTLLREKGLRVADSL